MKITSTQYSFRNYHINKVLGTADIQAHQKVLKETEKNFKCYFNHFKAGKEPTQKQITSANEHYIKYLNEKYPNKFNTVELSKRELYEIGYGMIVLGGGLEGGVKSQKDVEFIQQFNIKTCKSREVQNEFKLLQALINKGADLTKPTFVISKFLKNSKNEVSSKTYGSINLHESIHLEQYLNGFFEHRPSLSQNPQETLNEIKESKNLFLHTIKQFGKSKPDYSHFDKMNNFPKLFEGRLHYELANLIAYKNAMREIPTEKRFTALDRQAESYGMAYYNAYNAVYNREDRVLS